MYHKMPNVNASFCMCFCVRIVNITETLTLLKSKKGEFARMEGVRGEKNMIEAALYS